MEKKKMLLLVLILMGRMLDGVTTHIALTSGCCYEANPIAARVLEMWGFEGMYVTLLLHVLAIYSVVEAIMRVCEYGMKTRPKWGWYFRGVKRAAPIMMIVLSWIPVINNVFQLYFLVPI